MSEPITKVDAFQFPGVEVTTYKDEPGTWMAVTRRVLGGGDTAFEARYFEIAPGGYTSFERHAHEHFVVVLRGKGRVRLHDGWSDLAQHDVVRIGGNVPHQFANGTTEPFGILCVVDKVRDRPILLDTDGAVRTSE